MPCTQSTAEIGMNHCATTGSGLTGRLKEWAATIDGGQQVGGAALNITPRRDWAGRRQRIAAPPTEWRDAISTRLITCPGSSQAAHLGRRLFSQ